MTNTTNVGFARAVNQALPLATGRYFLLLNSDTRPAAGSLSELVAEADRWPDVGLVAPTICHPETGETQAPLKPFLTRSRLFERRTAAKPLVRLPGDRRRLEAPLDTTGPHPPLGSAQCGPAAALDARGRAGPQHARLSRR